MRHPTPMRNFVSVYSPPYPPSRQSMATNNFLFVRLVELKTKRREESSGGKRDRIKSRQLVIRCFRNLERNRGCYRWKFRPPFYLFDPLDRFTRLTPSRLSSRELPSSSFAFVRILRFVIAFVHFVAFMFCVLVIVARISTQVTFLMERTILMDPPFVHILF